MKSEDYRLKLNDLKNKFNAEKEILDKKFLKTAKFKIGDQIKDIFSEIIIKSIRVELNTLNNYEINYYGRKTSGSWGNNIWEKNAKKIE